MTSTDDPRTAVVDGVDVDAVHAAAAATPGVVRVGSREPGAAATYLPGRRVAGVRVEPERVTVEVGARWGVDIGELYSALRRSLDPLVAGRLLHVVIADIEMPG